MSKNENKPKLKTQSSIDRNGVKEKKPDSNNVNESGKFLSKYVIVCLFIITLSSLLIHTELENHEEDLFELLHKYSDINRPDSLEKSSAARKKPISDKPIPPESERNIKSSINEGNVAENLDRIADIEDQIIPFNDIKNDGDAKNDKKTNSEKLLENEKYSKMITELYNEVTTLTEEVLKDDPDNNIVKQIAPHLEGVLRDINSKKTNGIETALLHIREMLIELKERLAEMKNSKAKTSDIINDDKIPVDEVIPDPIYIAPRGQHEINSNPAENIHQTVSNKQAEQAAVSDDVQHKTLNKNVETEAIIDDVQHKPNIKEAKQAVINDEVHHKMNSKKKQVTTNDEVQHKPNNKEAKKVIIHDEVQHKPSNEEAKQVPINDDAQHKSKKKVKQEIIDDEVLQKPNNEKAKQETITVDLLHKANNKKTKEALNDDVQHKPNKKEAKQVAINDELQHKPNNKEEKQVKHDDAQHKSKQKVKQEIIDDEVLQKKNNEEMKQETINVDVPDKPNNKKVMKDAINDDVQHKPNNKEVKHVNINDDEQHNSNKQSEEERSNEKLRHEKRKWEQTREEEKISTSEAQSDNNKITVDVHNMDDNTDQKVEINNKQSQELIDFNLASSLISSKPEEAIQIFESLLINDAHSPTLLLGNARALKNLSENNKSNRILEKCIATYKSILYLAEKSPSSVPDDILRAAGLEGVECMDFRGQRKSLLNSLLFLVQHFPHDIEFLNKLGYSYLLMDKFESATEQFEMVLKYDPANTYAIAHMGYVLQIDKGNCADAINYFSKLSYDDGDSALQSRFFMHYGDCLIRLEDRNAAERLYEEGARRGYFMNKNQRSIYNVKTLKSQPVWTLDETTYKVFFQVLEKNWYKILSEGLSIIENQKGLVSDFENLVDVGHWDQFTLFGRGVMNKTNCLLAPVTCSLIQSFDPAASNKRGQVKFSVMYPGTHVHPHTGPTNCRLRAHLGLVIPKSGMKFRVMDKFLSWEEGKVIVFDDSFEHEVWHDGDRLRLVLIVDVYHPQLTDDQKKSLSVL